MIITIQDLRKAKMCNKGVRQFAKLHGLDWNNFIKNGIDEKEVAHIENAMAQRVIEAANGK